jgi:5-methylcytosine-specific restriction endonuclease McrA
MRRSRVCTTLGCPNLQPCPIHARPGNAPWSPGRDRVAQARFRRAVLARDHHACRNCGATRDLRACHILPLEAGGTYEPGNGITRCATCDRATDPRAR